MTAGPTLAPENPSATVQPVIHAKLPNGIAPTIAINPNRGYAGQSITVSGQSVTGYPQVRIVSVFGGQTQGNVTVDAAADGRYTFQFIIPSTVTTGAIELCATVAGATNAEFACTPLQIDPAPVAQVSGELPPGVLSTGATFGLYTSAGKLAFSAPINQSGSFALNGVRAGVYQTCHHRSG